MKTKAFNPPMSVARLVDGYQDTTRTVNQEDSSDPGRIVGLGGKLNIRPPYQRNFVYEGGDLHEVLRTVSHGHPLGVMYWMKNADGGYEVLDGQQRIISSAQFVAEQRFSCGGLFGYAKDEIKTFGSLAAAEQQAILNYQLLIYVCEGDDREREEWFKAINIKGKELSDQERRNAIYHGAWLDDAKERFSWNNCPGYRKGNPYISGAVKVNRQGYLQKAIEWAARGGGRAGQSGEAALTGYMAKHRKKKNATALWDSFCAVIDWVEAVFPEYFPAMKSADWGELYHSHKDGKHEAKAKKYAARIKKLMADEDVSSKAGIYEYILTGHERHLNIRAFTDVDRQSVFARQNKKCNACNKPFALNRLQADHIRPWSENGPTILDNCQLLCTECHADKTTKQLRGRKK